MHNRRLSLYSHLSILLCSATLFPGDNYTGKVYFEDPTIMGTTSMVGVPNMPSVPMDITPNIPDIPNSTGSSGWGGLAGFIVNLGKTAEDTKRAADIADAAAKKLAAQTLTPGMQIAGAQFSALDPNPTIDFSKITIAPPQTFPVTAAPTISPAVAEVLEKAMSAKTPNVPDMSQLLRDNPLKALTGNNSGGGSGMAGLAGGAGLLTSAMAAKTAGATATVGGATAATAGGTTVATTTTWGATAMAAAPWVAVVGGGIALGVLIGKAIRHVYPVKPYEPIKPLSEYVPSPAVLAEIEKRNERLDKLLKDYDNFNKAPKQNFNYDNNSSNTPNPKKPREPKERKFNNVQRTEALSKIKENYRFDKQTRLYKLKDNGTPIKCTRTGKDVINVKWDGAHGDIEALKKNLDHMGSLDPVTFEMYKGPVVTRIEKV